MKTLRLKLFQETACYKKPAAFKVGETYPLPPYATVKGMLHQVLQADRYIPMKLSIQGRYESRLVDYQKHYFFKKSNTLEFPLILDGLAFDYNTADITSMPIYMHMLLNVELVIHIRADKEVLDLLHLAFTRQNVTYSLGRWEDLVRIDECKYVECARDEDRDDRETILPIYIPVSVMNSAIGVPYRLNWKYEIVQDIRQWNKIKVRYVPEGEWLGDAEIDFDEDGYPVAIPLEMEE
ncbi:type I-B CRISPR-associated protein Cas5b [Paenibacillus cisolokensis]|uniref:type I-B CRISPR-associated protein Cas5b n=1 Tax=Paenibacillus cisolokensis TaxID=1658519 RepID=UPI003D2CA9A9